MVEKLGDAFHPMLAASNDLQAAARLVSGTLEVLAGHERSVRATVDDATAISKEIVENTLPPYWPYMLGTCIALALSGFVIMGQPDMRLPFIAGIGFLLGGLVAHYGWRLLRRGQLVAPLQERFDAAEQDTHRLFAELTALEQELSELGFRLETDSYLPYQPIVARLAEGNANEEDWFGALTEFVTGDAKRHSEDPVDSDAGS